MKRYKWARGLWIFTGLLFLITSIINYKTLSLPNNNNKSYLGLVLSIVSCIMTFICAYLNHKMLGKDNKA